MASLHAFEFLPAPGPAHTHRPGPARRWPVYHGSTDWFGLLDPLDPTLRRELLRYGRFVQTAYTAFGSGRSSPLDALLARTGYVATRDLYASSGIRLPGRTAGPTSWVGYVAVCEDEEEISRLGRRDAVIAYRGTATWAEWAENFRVGLSRVPVGPEEEDEDEDAMVQTGFWSLYTSRGLRGRSLREEVRAEVNRLVHMYGRAEPLSITVTGHSLGAALAILTANDIAAALRQAGRPRVAVFSFGSPRVGNRAFRRRVEEGGVKVLRIVNPRDIVTKVPAAGDVDGWLAGWAHAGRASYSDVGNQLTVTCESGGPKECHDLDVYLQLLMSLAATCRDPDIQSA